MPPQHPHGEGHSGLDLYGLVLCTVTPPTGARAMSERSAPSSAALEDALAERERDAPPHPLSDSRGPAAPDHNLDL